MNKPNYFIKDMVIPAGAAAALIAFDQATKHLVRQNIALGDVKPVLSFFNLTYVTNTGIGFSLFQGANSFFALFTALVLAGFIAWYAVNARGLQGLVRTAVILVVSGAAGNLADRIQYGHVTDFLDVFYGAYHWPAFNVADSCISIGATLLFIWILISGKEENLAKKSENVPDSN